MLAEIFQFLTQANYLYRLLLVLASQILVTSRLTLKDATDIIEQEVTRMNEVYARHGLRAGYDTQSKILQTLIIDASYLSVDVTIQNSKPRAFAFLTGTRFGF